jgi:hypothetical protein
LTDADNEERPKSQGDSAPKGAQGAERKRKKKKKREREREIFFISNNQSKKDN